MPRSSKKPNNPILYTSYIATGCNVCDPHKQFNFDINKDSYNTINDIVSLHKDNIYFLCKVCKNNCFNLKRYDFGQRIYFRISSKNIDFCFFSYSVSSFSQDSISGTITTRGSIIKTKIDVCQINFVKTLQETYLESFDELHSFLSNIDAYNERISKLLVLA